MTRLNLVDSRIGSSPPDATVRPRDLGFLREACSERRRLCTASTLLQVLRRPLKSTTLRANDRLAAMLSRLRPDRTAMAMTAQNDSAARPELDDDTIAFAGRMFDAARAGDTDMLGPLLEAGLPPNLRNDKGDTLLMLAAYHQHEGMVRQLLRAGSDPEIFNDRNQTPLAGAAFKGALPVVRVLLEHGAAVDGAGPDGRTALMVAAMFNRVEIVELLLKHGADPARQDASGLTAHDAAQRMGAVDTARLLSLL
jgi:hypothetical protein